MASASRTYKVSPMIASPRGELKAADVPVPSVLAAVPDPAKVETDPWLMERVVVRPAGSPGFVSGLGGGLGHRSDAVVVRIGDIESALAVRHEGLGVVEPRRVVGAVPRTRPFRGSLRRVSSPRSWRHNGGCRCRCRSPRRGSCQQR